MNSRLTPFVCRRAEGAGVQESRLLRAHRAVDGPWQRELCAQRHADQQRRLSEGYQALYHSNFSTPFLEQGARFVAPVKQVSPFNDKAKGDLPDWQTYRAPTRDYDETVYNVVPYADAKGDTLAVLHNKAGSLGVYSGSIPSSCRCSPCGKTRIARAGLSHRAGAGYQLLL